LFILNTETKLPASQTGSNVAISSHTSRHCARCKWPLYTGFALDLSGSGLWTFLCRSRYWPWS